RLFSSCHRPEVLFAPPLPPAGVFEDRDAREVDRPLPTRVVATVLHVEHDATLRRVDHVPLVGCIDRSVLRLDRLDPCAHRLPSPHRPVEMLDVDAVLGEEIGPRVPVLTDGAGAPVHAEGLLELLVTECAHTRLLQSTYSPERTPRVRRPTCTLRDEPH